MLNKLKNRFRAIRWWFQRANGKVPPCDCWDYKYTLVDNIRQGLEYLLYDGMTDWENPYHSKTEKELMFVLDWAIEFPYYDSAIYAIDEGDKKKLLEKFEGTKRLVITKKEFDEWEKRTEKAFKYLAKNISGLWD